MAGNIGFRADLSFFVIPAHGSRQKRARGQAPAGIQSLFRAVARISWIPAFAGMTI
jgi:hypothetical protein